jgi:hypothetical protein
MHQKRGVQEMAGSVIYVVQICSDRAGVRAFARAATSASTEEFTSAEALWGFLVNDSLPRGDAAGHGQITAPPRTASKET